MTVRLALGEDDVLRLMQDTTPAARVIVTDKISQFYTASHLDKNGFLAAEQIFRLLVRDTEVKVRAAMAKHLKLSKRIPRDIVMDLARDVEEVSLPMLESSEVLTDKDLLELLSAKQEVSRYLAVTRRKVVNEIVSSVLIDSGNAQVASALISNQAALISADGFSRIVELHRNNEPMLKSVSDHPHVPVVVVEKIISFVSAQLADALRRKHNIEIDQIRKEVDQSHEDETLTLVRYAGAQKDADRLINQLQQTNNLNPSLILSALCQGNFAFFEICLAKMSNIPLSNARTLIADRGELGFRAIYNKAGLPEGLFPAVKLLLKVVRELDSEGCRPGAFKYASSLVDRVLYHAQQTPVDNLSYVIALVRRVAR
jgi:uncharacterized protein (DUF2336 family)